MTDEELEARVLELEREVQRQEDVEEIKRLHYTYIRQLADRNWADMLEHFTDDAVVDLRHHGPRRGREELSQLFAAMHATGTPPDGYILSSPVVEVSGDRATGVWTWHRHLCEFSVGGGTIRMYGPWWEGRYVSEYAREDGRWKFSSLRFRLVAPDPDLEPEQMQELRERGEAVVLGGPNRIARAAAPAGRRS
jgi:ketosteroid isomerase-like protein